ncbi:MAG: hypothetical protein MJE66_20050 [Proteobacteria bacterium]|nr:hypothetical protein [Pseudomonadota bacterium]
MDYEIRALSLAEILDMGFRLLRDRFGLLTGLAAIVYAPSMLVMGLLTRTLEADFTADSGLAPDLLIGVGVVWLATLAMLPFVVAAITSAIGNLYLGRPVSVGDAARAGLHHLLPLGLTYLIFFVIVSVALIIATFVLVGGSVFVGQLAGAAGSTPVGVGVAITVFILGLLLAYLLALLPMLVLPQIVVFEDTSFFAAIARAWQLLTGHRWRSLGVWVTTYLMISIPVFAFQFLFLVLPMGGLIGMAAAQAIGFAYYSAVTVVLYFDLRSRQEAFDLEHLAALVEAEDATRGGAVSPQL